MRRLRNLVAHHWTLSLLEVKRLLREPEFTPLLAGYPAAMEADFRRTARLLGRLIAAREFRNPHPQRHLDVASIQIDKVFD